MKNQSPPHKANKKSLTKITEYYEIGHQCLQNRQKLSAEEISHIAYLLKLKEILPVDERYIVVTANLHDIKA